MIPYRPLSDESLNAYLKADKTGPRNSYPLAKQNTREQVSNKLDRKNIIALVGGVQKHYFSGLRLSWAFHCPGSSWVPPALVPPGGGCVRLALDVLQRKAPPLSCTAGNRLFHSLEKSSCDTSKRNTRERFRPLAMV